MPEKILPVVTKTTPVERRSKRLRQFLAAVGRYRPLLVLSLDAVNGENHSATDSTLPVLVVTDEGLDWATVDRLSDGIVQAAVYRESELLHELDRPDSVLFEAVAKGMVLYGTQETRTRLLLRLPATVEESWQPVRV